MNEDKYVEVMEQGGFYHFFHVKGDDKNRYMSLPELLRYHPEAKNYVEEHRKELEEEFRKQ